MKITGMGINFPQKNNINRLFEGNKVNKNEEEKKKSLTLKQNNKNGENKAMENLQKLKENFEKQKEDLRNKEMDPDEKKYKMKEVNENIKQIDAQIQQLQIQQKEEEAEKKKEEIEKKKAEEEKYNKDEVREGVVISASLNELIEASHSKEKIHILKEVKNRSKIESLYIKPDSKPNSYVNTRLDQINKSISVADSKVAKEVRGFSKIANKMRDKIDDRLEEIDEIEKREEKEAKGEE